MQRFDCPPPFFLVLGINWVLLKARPLGVPQELTKYSVAKSSAVKCGPLQILGTFIFVAYTYCRKASAKMLDCALWKYFGANLKRAFLLFSDRERANEIGDLLFSEGVDCVKQTTRIRMSKILEECKRFNHNAALISEKVVSSQLAVICRDIRETNPFIAILALFHKPNPALEEKLFNIGVDDIVSESAPAGSIAKRILVRMHTRQKLFGGHDVIGKAFVDSKSFLIRVEGKIRPISKGLLELLQYFQCHPSRIISREEVVKTLWCDSVVDPEGKNLDVQVGKLQRLIEPNPKKPIII